MTDDAEDNSDGQFPRFQSPDSDWEYLEREARDRKRNWVSKTTSSITRLFSAGHWP